MYVTFVAVLARFCTKVDACASCHMRSYRTPAQMFSVEVFGAVVLVLGVLTGTVGIQIPFARGNFLHFSCLRICDLV